MTATALRRDAVQLSTAPDQPSALDYEFGRVTVERQYGQLLPCPQTLISIMT